MKDKALNLSGSDEQQPSPFSTEKSWDSGLRVLPSTKTSSLPQSLFSEL